ncbi:hypothetical protein Q9R29_00725 [Rothia sp. ARF10]|nr:hypothetical protein [Rothia sp. ARF10]
MTPREKPAYTTAVGRSATERTPRARTSPKPTLPQYSAPSSIDPKVRPSKRSGVWTVWPAPRSASAKATTPGVRPWMWWKRTMSVMAPT